MSVQLTPGQRCLLDLLQRKLLSTIQSIAKLSLEKQDSGYNPDIEGELSRLKEKIRRISARQKRFTLEIINGNGNNTIPKETFFEALGLVTKEALSKLNSKTNERRRRTTANPRFSHEAIQAKRALEPKKPPRSSNISTNSSTNIGYLRKEVIAKLENINNKRKSNKKLEELNEEIRRRGLGIINALANLKQDKKNDDDNNDQMIFNNKSRSDEVPNLQSANPIDVWIDLKCDESLDGLD